MRIYHQVRVLKGVCVNFQVFFHWCHWTLCPEIRMKCRLSLLFDRKNAELMIAEPAVTVQIQRIEDLRSLLLTHSHSQLVRCLDEVVQ